MNAPHRRRRRQRGQSLVEFALVFPVFVMLVFGLIDLGRLVYVDNAIAQAAREGARWGSVQGRSSSATTRDDVRAYTLGIMTAVPGPTVAVSCELDGAARTACRTNDTLVVSVSSPVSMLTPVIGQLVGTVTVSSIAKVTVNQ